MTLASSIQRPLRIGTRGSKLALIQAQQVKDRLSECYPELSSALTIVPIVTSGDHPAHSPPVAPESLAELGGKWLFVKEIEAALLAGVIDMAVHSMKDVPTLLPPGLEIACMMPREDPQDAFVSPLTQKLDQLQAGARVGTSSLRRQAQILARHPHLRVVPLRGNVETRCRRLAEGWVEGIVLALAGLRRLAYSPSAILEPQQMLPAIGQGALGLEIRKDDSTLRELLTAIACARTWSEVTAERAIMASLDGSCRMPIAALARIDDNDQLSLDGAVFAPDGSWRVSTHRRGNVSEGIRLGSEAGDELKSRMPSD